MFSPQLYVVGFSFLSVLPALSKVEGSVLVLHVLSLPKGVKSKESKGALCGSKIISVTCALIFSVTSACPELVEGCSLWLNFIRVYSCFFVAIFPCSSMKPGLSSLKFI